MNLLEYIKNKISGFKANTYFEDYYMHVSDTIFLRSLEADFEKLKSVSDESRRILAENHQAKFEMLTPKEFANLTSSSGDYSMLQLASSKLNHGAVKLLVENGADVNYRAEFGLGRNASPLAYALGTEGRLLTPYDADEQEPDYGYDSSYNSRPKEVKPILVNFDDFRKTIDILVENGAYALDNSKINLTQKQKEQHSNEIVNDFLVEVLDGRQQFYSRTDENGEPTNVHNVKKSDVIKYVVSRPELTKSVTPAVIAIAKRYDMDSFIELFKTVKKEDRPELLRQIHGAEAYELAEDFEKLFRSHEMLENLGQVITENGGDINNPPYDFAGMAYREYEQKVEDLTKEYNMLSDSHAILTSYDSKETFEFTYPPFYMYRFRNGEVCDLNDYNRCARNYFYDNASIKSADEQYTADVKVAMPLLAKAGNAHDLELYLDPFKDALIAVCDEYFKDQSLDDEKDTPSGE